VVGQAPGPVEIDQTRPFAGRAGKQLMRWLATAGFGTEEQIRDTIYFTAMATCFPGKNPKGSGDRRPSAREVALCSHWLDGVLDLLEPEVIIPIGTLALSRFLPGVKLDDCVGRVFRGEGVILLPLPHPSGQSRWLNDPARVTLLEAGLAELDQLRQGVIARN
jgi:uracil-DNA glycosylase